MADKVNSRDDLIEKLDHLINRGRVPDRAPRAQFPVLTEALPDASADAVPTLTEAVAGPGQILPSQLARNELERIVAMRLAESIERVSSKLGGEFPAHRDVLDSLRTAVVKSLPEMVRRAFSEPRAPADTPRVWRSADTGKKV